MITIDIDPCPKPRQTRSDKWKKRPVVLKYRAFADELRAKLMNCSISGEIHVDFYVKMPKSWLKRKKEEMNGKPHTQKPDIDNLVKAVMDALLKEDSHIWALSATKRWSDSGKIEFYGMKNYLGNPI